MKKTGANGFKLKMSFRRKLIIAFSILVFVTIYIMGTIQYFSSKNILEDNLIACTGQSVAICSEYVSSYLKNYEEKVKRGSEAISSKSASLNSPETTYLDLTNVLNSNPEIQNVYIGNEKGEMLLQPKVDLPEGFDPRERVWYIEAMESGDIIWTEPYLDASSGKITVSCARAIPDASVKGVYALDLLLSRLTDSLDSMKVGKKLHPFILTKSGMVVTHSDKELLGEIYPDKPVLDAINKGSADSNFIDINGEKFIFTMKKLKNIDWYVVALINHKEVVGIALSGLLGIVIGGVIVLVFSVIVVYTLTMLMIKGVKQLVYGLDSVKEGDLSVPFEVKSKDEVGMIAYSLNDTVSSIRNMIVHIKNISGDLISVSEKLKAASQNTSKSAYDISRTVDDIAQGAGDQAQDAENSALIANSLAFKFNELSEKSAVMISSTEDVEIANKNGIEAVRVLKEKTELNDVANVNIENAVLDLDSKTQAITAILDSISSIAEQTNLLALNASIEAARAGEHGKGFAVVADEIRKLAEDSSKSADEVRIIVDNIKRDSKKTVDSVKEVKEISTEQSMAVDSVAEQFTVISSAIEKISSGISDLSLRIDHLGEDKEKLVMAISNISSVSEQSAASSEEVSASIQQQVAIIEEVAGIAETVNDISATLCKEIGGFKID